VLYSCLAIHSLLLYLSSLANLYFMILCFTKAEAQLDFLKVTNLTHFMKDFISLTSEVSFKISLHLKFAFQVNMAILNLYSRLSF